MQVLLALERIEHDEELTFEVYSSLYIFSQLTDHPLVMFLSLILAAITCSGDQFVLK